MDASDPRKRLITVTEQASVNGAPADLQYHGGGIGGATATQPYQNTDGRNYDLLFSASYITGTHAFKVGASDTIVLRDESLDDNIYHVSYRFNNTIPNQITQRSTPYTKAQRQPAGIGLYAQDKWTHRPADAQPRPALRLPEDLHSGAAPRPGAARARTGTSICPRPIWSTGRT